MIPCNSTRYPITDEYVRGRRPEDTFKEFAVYHLHCLSTGSVPLPNHVYDLPGSSQARHSLDLCFSENLYRNKPISLANRPCMH